MSFFHILPDLTVAHQQSSIVTSQPVLKLTPYSLCNPDLCELGIASGTHLVSTFVDELLHCEYLDTDTLHMVKEDAIEAYRETSVDLLRHFLHAAIPMTATLHLQLEHNTHTETKEIRLKTEFSF